MKRSLFLFLSIILPALPLQAIEDGTSFNTNAPTTTNIPSWTSGWGSTSATGWNYVGEVDSGPSCVYLGNGWVITAGHVGYNNIAQDNVTLGGVRYLAIATSGVGITANNQPVDLFLFKIANPPNLPPLVIRGSDPVVGNPVAILGFGGGYGETWGYDTVNYINSSTTLSANQNYTSNDFLTFAHGYMGTSNTAFLVSGDSGGGDFIYNSATSHWELAGINEAVGPSLDNIEYCFYVQLDTYAAQINAIIMPTDTPTLPFPGLVALTLLLLFVVLLSFRTRPSFATKK